MRGETDGGKRDGQGLSLHAVTFGQLFALPYLTYLMSSMPHTGEGLKGM